MAESAGKEREGFDPEADLPPPICEFCGMPIEADGQQCVALVDGRCAP